MSYRVGDEVRAIGMREGQVGLITGVFQLWPRSAPTPVYQVDGVLYPAWALTMVERRTP